MAKKTTKKNNQKEDILIKIYDQIKDTSSIINLFVANDKKNENKEEKNVEFIKNKLTTLLNKTEGNTNQTKKILDKISEFSKIFSSINNTLQETKGFSQQQTEIAEKSENRREESESENSESENDFRSKMTKLLEEIKNNTSVFGKGGRGGGGGGGGGLGGLLSSLGVAGSIIGLATAAAGAFYFLNGGERIKTIGSDAADTAALGAAGGTSASNQMGKRPTGLLKKTTSRLLRGNDAAVEMNEGISKIKKGAGRIKRAATGDASVKPKTPSTPPKAPTPSGAAVEPATPTRKLTSGQRFKSGIRGVRDVGIGSTKIGTGVARTTMQSGRSGLLGAAAAGTYETAINWRTLTDPNIPWERKAEILKGIGTGMAKGALVGVGYHLLSTAARTAALATGTQLGGQIATRIIPGVGWALLAYDLIKTSMYASEQGRAIAEGQIWEEKNAEFEKNMKNANQKTVEAQGIVELMKAGQIPEEELPEAEKAVKERMNQAENISDNTKKELYKWHSITQTQDALDKIVDMDGWFWAGQVYSLEDAVNMISVLDKKPREWDEKIHGSWNDQSTYDKLLLIKQGYFPSIGYVNKLIEGIGITKTQMLFDQGKEATKDYRDNLWAKPSQYEQKYFPNKDSMEKPVPSVDGISISPEQTKQTPQIPKEQEKPGAGVEGDESLLGTKSEAVPKAKTEAIHPGDSKKRGNPIVIGDGPGEAVLSTKHNFVTEQIGKNIYQIIKEEKTNDFKSLQKEESMIISALNNTISSFFNSYILNPALGKGIQDSSSSKTVINNFTPPIAQDRTERNASFNMGGLDSTNTETILQRVYLESYKAQLL